MFEVVLIQPSFILVEEEILVPTVFKAVCLSSCLYHNVVIPDTSAVLLLGQQLTVIFIID